VEINNLEKITHSINKNNSHPQTETIESTQTGTPLRTKQPRSPASFEGVYKKCKWDLREDSILVSLVKRYGEKNWAEIAYELNKRGSKLGYKAKRTNKQVRERFINHLK